MARTGGLAVTNEKGLARRRRRYGVVEAVSWSIELEGAWGSLELLQQLLASIRAAGLTENVLELMLRIGRHDERGVVIGDPIRLRPGAALALRGVGLVRVRVPRVDLPVGVEHSVDGLGGLGGRILPFDSGSTEQMIERTVLEGKNEYVLREERGPGREGFLL